MTIMAIILLSGCVSRPVATEEVKISKTTGIGVLDFGVVVQEMVADTYNYIILSIRNNAEGNNAKDIRASLDNVEPFTIYECNLEHEPTDLRVDVCNQFFDDYDVPYRSHKINEMIPDEEIQFFWNVKAPTDSEIVDMGLEHTVYYTLEYNYTSTVTQTIAAISQEEYLELSKEGPVSLSGQTISSPGELKLESNTQQPLIFSEGSEVPLDFTLEFDITNTGDGVPMPGTRILVAVKKGDLTEYGENLRGWTAYGKDMSCETLSDYPDLYSQECDTGHTSYSPGTIDKQFLTNWFDEVFPYIEFDELGAEGGVIRDDLMLTSVSAEQLRGSSYSLLLPMKFKTLGIFEPQKILTVSAYISYKYLKEGYVKVDVFPSQ